MGIIAAVIIVAAIAAFASYSMTTETTDDPNAQTDNSEGKHVTVGFSDGVGVSSNP